MKASRDFRDEIAMCGRRGRSFLSSDGRPALTGDTANRSAFESSQQVSASLHGYDGFSVCSDPVTVGCGLGLPESTQG